MAINKFGLIGYPLSHSFSKKYFSEKFAKELIHDTTYNLFPIPEINALPELIKSNPDLIGLNVTIPYKEAVIPYLNDLDKGAEAVGAVNTIVVRGNHLKGYNTDVFGFVRSLTSFIPKPFPPKALILGSGGAAKAVGYGLKKLGIQYLIVSRTAGENKITYADLSSEVMESYKLIINTTPLGMHPKIDICPPIPYQYLTGEHFLYDLIYNPEETCFLRHGKEQNCNTKNGMEMLILQAEQSWKIWNKSRSSMKENNQFVDFTNTEIAFSHKNDRELKKAAWLFNLMNSAWLVKMISTLALTAVKLRIPFTKYFVKSTIFELFVGGETLQESQKKIDILWSKKTLSVLDYGAEGKTEEKDLDYARDQFLKAIVFAASNESVPLVSTKVSALAENALLEKVQLGNSLSEDEKVRYQNVRNRVEALCKKAFELGVKIFIDAEESWIQDPLDDMTNEMMSKYNKEKITVYNTFQLYRHDRYDYLVKSYQIAKAGGYILGAKLVRGAYMEKERHRAHELGYPSPIHKTKEDTDRDFNRAILFCMDHFEEIASCAATHNMQSCLYQAEIIGERNLPRNHPHLNFSQLFGMSDHVTFNLASEGFNVAKYVVYGQVDEVLPYLVRRAEENTAVSGEFSREYQYLKKEIKRRGI